MILGIDGGLATMGWAVVTPRTGRVIEVGALIQKPQIKELGVHVDRKRRADVQAKSLAGVASRYEITAIAVEEMSFAPRSSAAAKIGIGLSWGVVLGLAHALRVPHIVVPPKMWQRAIVPPAAGEKKSAAIDYELVYAALATYVDAQETRLDVIAPSHRTHPLDASGIGIYASLVELPKFHKTFHDAREGAST